MIDVIKLIASVVALTFKSRARLEMEHLVLRHQVMILRREPPRLGGVMAPYGQIIGDFS